MNEYGVFYGFWAEQWGGGVKCFEGYLSKADELGFDILELNCDSLMELSESERRKLREEAEKRKMDLTFNTNLDENNDISSRKQEVREKGIEHLEKCLEMMDEMGGKILTGVTYGPWNPSFRGGLDEKYSRFERSAKTMREVVDTAESLDICVTVEPVNRFEQFILNTSEEAVEYVEMVGSSNLKILLDTFHMNIEEDSIEEAILEAGDMLEHFHVGENNRRPPGRGGHIRWDEVADGLREVDYEGGIVMEPFLLPGEDIGSDVKVWRDLVGDKNLDEEAKRSLEFLKEKIGGR